MRIKKLKLVAMVSIILISTNAHTQSITQNCAVVSWSDGNDVFTGNNEDYIYPFTSVFTFPPSSDKYGCIIFGFSFSETNQGYCGGMNDQGLFIDGLGITNTGWQPDESKPWTRDIEGFKGNLESYVLQHFGTVDEVISFFEKYNVPHFQTGKFLIADKSGASIVVEWGQNKLQILKENENYQIATNFVQSNFKRGEYPDFRYNLAEKVFNNSKDHTNIGTIKEVLSAVHWEELENHISTTLYSYICDLKKGDIYIYNFHHFEVAVKLNIYDELKKGENIYPLISLFPYETYAENVWKGQKVVSLLYDRIKNEGVNGENGSIALYNVWKSSAIFNHYTVSEELLLSVADKLKNDKRFNDAIELCKFIVSEHPDSDIASNGLSMAYFDAGEMQLAKENLERHLKKNPDNTSAKWYIELVNASSHPTKIDESVLKQYEGIYGERKLIFENGILFYQLGSGAKRELTPINDTTFRVKEIDYYRIGIIQNRDQVIAIEGIYMDGRNFRYDKTI
ncbi:MAG: linear amide C-N hydrolase [Bacteroidetes bacterium]|nr:linear amide C-N hydrolase [Bacteroidota bacterium]